MLDHLTHILVSKFHVDPAAINPSVTLDVLQLDSLDVVELGLVIEKEMGARITDDELFEAQSLEAIVRLVERRHATV
jgi:acyl carrier protein